MTAAGGAGVAPGAESLPKLPSVCCHLAVHCGMCGASKESANPAGILQQAHWDLPCMQNE